MNNLNIDPATFENTHLQKVGVINLEGKAVGLEYSGEIFDQDVLVRVKSLNLNMGNVINPALIRELMAIPDSELEVFVGYDLVDLNTILH